MKSKDVLALVFAAVIFLVAGYIGYTQLFAPKTTAKASGAEVEVVGNIPTSLDQSVIDTLGDPNKVQDYTPIMDLTTGLGTTQPFGH